VPEIKGTLWVDRKSAEVRRLEFRYVNVSAEAEDHAGGDLEFIRLRDGAWTIAHWEIRMPVVEQVIVPGHGAEPRVAEVLGMGGDLALARRGADTLWRRAPSTLTLADAARLLEAHVTVAKPVENRDATFIGAVVFDSTFRPIAGAEVSLPDLGKSVLAGADGRFRVTRIPPGEHRVVVRQIGYGAADVRVTFAAGETLDRQVVLGRAVGLSTVKVTATQPVIPSFEEHRRIGLGHFLTRAELAKLEGRRLNSVIEQFPGAHVVSGRGGGGWVRSRRISSGMPVFPERADSAAGAPPASCYSQVYLDKVLVFAGRKYSEDGRQKWEPLFNLNSIAPEQIEAIEFYAGPSETPLEYSRTDSQCGVLVIWTRRSP
jgi:hypothetical protein